MLKELARRVAPRWLWRRLRAWRLRHQLAAFRPRTVEHTYAGIPLKVHLADPLAAGWYDRDWGPLPEIDLLRGGALAAGARVFDLGAHQGIVAMLLAKAVGPTGQVVAVEAHPHNARLCKLNRDLNGLGQICVEAAAVAAAPGEIDLCIDLNAHVKNHATTNNTVRVPAVTVDGLAERYGPPQVLFLDVEGYECQALRGAARTLERLPDCYVEIHGGYGLELAGGSAEEVLSLFPARHYDFLAWTENSAQPVPLWDGRACPPGRFFLVARRRPVPGG
jgi:FkbM family methyltransferase